MRYVKPRPAAFVLAAYVLAAAAVGLAVPALKAQAAERFGREGVAVMLVVNCVMPLLIAALSAAYPKLSMALLGTFLASLTFLITGGLNLPAAGAHGLLDAAGQIRPVLVLACLAYHAIAALTVAAIRPWRTVGGPLLPGSETE